MVDNILKYEKKVEDDYYFILGCDELSTPEQICAEYKARILNCHPDKNVSNPQAAEQFAKLQRAKEVLCNEELRGQYDAWRRCGIAMPFDEWTARKAYTSIHWFDGERKKPMLTDASHQNSPCENKSSSASPWNRDESDIVQRFRSYNI